MAKSRHKPAALVKFFKRLERLAAYMHATRYNVNHRIDSYAKLITEIENSVNIDEFSQLDFDQRSIKDFREALNGDVYQLTPRRRNYLILRLDSFISDGAATYDPKILTIEHVLPQTVEEDSEWAEWWPDEEKRELWVHRLANLVPLNKKRNSAAQNYSFALKRDVYFQGNNNVSSYALTTQVLAKNEWKQQDLKLRQKELINAMMSGWELE